MDKLKYVIKTLAAILCITLFLVNNYVIFNQFASGKTIVCSNIKYEEKLSFPTFVICNASAFKNPKVLTVDLEEYLKDTFKLSDTLISITVAGGYGSSDKPINDEILYNATQISPHIQIESVHTLYRGHCYRVEYQKKVMYIKSISR